MDSKINLKEGKSLNGVIPSADITMRSVAKAYGERVIGVILTGMGKDGARGISDIKHKKGRTIVQDRETSVIFGMPQAALKSGQVDKVVELKRIHEILIKEVSS
jgi:two-component system chemotaxis response regulator CheB